MHVPDGFLSAGVAASSWAAGASCLAWALRAERSEPEGTPAGTLGALAAFTFAAQLVNVPLLPGTSGHLVGGTLAAAIVGPWRGLLVMAVVLAVQALLFQDGGITAYGANLLAMGAAGALGGYAVSALVARLATNFRSTTETLGVGTRIETPSSLPFSSGSTRPIALAAPVEVGICESAAARAR